MGASPDATSVSGRSGGTSKDTWVSTSQPALQQSAWLRPIRIPEADEAGVSGRAPGEPADGEVPRDLDTPLPSRAAAHLFIMGRAAEHAEVVIRLLRTVLARLDQPLGSLADDGAGGAASLGVLVEAIGVLAGFDTVSEPDRDDEDDRPDAEVAPVPEGVADGMGSVERRALAIVLDAGTDGSLVTSLSVLIDAAYSVREQLSADSWQIIGDVEEELARLRARPPTRLVGVQDGLQRLLRALLALAGLAAENMVRDPAWLFLDAGRRPRAGPVPGPAPALRTRRHPAGRGGGPPPRVAAEDGREPHRLPPPGPVADAGRRRPRPARLRPDQPPQRPLPAGHAARAAGAAPRGSSLSPAGRLSPEERLVLEAATALRLTDPGRLAAVDGGRRAHLDLVAERVDRLLTATLATLRRAYFAHERLAAMAERSLARVVPVRRRRPRAGRGLGRVHRRRAGGWHARRPCSRADRPVNRRRSR